MQRNETLYCHNEQALGFPPIWDRQKDLMLALGSFNMQEAAIRITQSFYRWNLWKVLARGVIFWSANQMTGFYMKCNIWLRRAKQLRQEWELVVVMCCLIIIDLAELLFLVGDVGHPFSISQAKEFSPNLPH